MECLYNKTTREWYVGVDIDIYAGEKTLNIEIFEHKRFEENQHVDVYIPKDEAIKLAQAILNHYKQEEVEHGTLG